MLFVPFVATKKNGLQQDYLHKIMLVKQPMAATFAPRNKNGG
ncbi:MAG: hypothetical protein ABIX01_02170 [Chitinophagaceae bacterium]